MSNDRRNPVYQAALEADEAFQRELVRAYGSEAGDARYKAHHEDARVTAAREAKRAADTAWLATGSARGWCALA